MSESTRDDIPPLPVVPPGKRLVTFALSKGGVGKSSTAFHLARWFAIVATVHRLRVKLFDPDGSNKSLTYLTGGKSQFKAVVVNALDREELMEVANVLERDEAEISCLDGIGSHQEQTIDKKWFEKINIPAVCASMEARVTLALIVDNTTEVYGQILRTVRKYAGVPNVDFVLFHVRRDQTDEVTTPFNRDLYNDFFNGAAGNPGVKQLLPDWENRYAFVVIPHFSTRIHSYMFGARGTILDLANWRYINARGHIADYQSIWTEYRQAFEKAGPLLLPVGMPVPKADPTGVLSAA